MGIATHTPSGTQLSLGIVLPPGSCFQTRGRRGSELRQKLLRCKQMCERTLWQRDAPAPGAAARSPCPW